jgi:hypothetical protein
MEYSQNDNLLLQSYFTISFLTELKNVDFLNSDYFKSAEFEDKFVKESITRVGIDNQGSLLIYLYSMLVVPRQLLETEFPTEFEALNGILNDINSNAESNYSSDSEQIDFVRHIRNSVAHARVEFIPGQSVTFTDTNNSGSMVCNITIPLDEIGEFLMALQLIFFSYVEKLKSKNQN